MEIERGKNRHRWCRLCVTSPICETRRIYQVIPFVNEEEEGTAAADALPDKALGRCRGGSDEPIRRQKKTASIALCAAIGTHPEETIAFGDAERFENTAAGRYRRGNGMSLPQVRACADMVAGTVKNDGIAHALRN